MIYWLLMIVVLTSGEVQYAGGVFPTAKACQEGMGTAATTVDKDGSVAAWAIVKGSCDAPETPALKVGATLPHAP